MLNFNKDYEIPEEGITDQFKINSYASFAMELLNIVKDEKKMITVYEINEWQGEKEYTEIIEVKDENNNITNAEKKIKKNVLSYTAVMTSNVQTVINGKRKAKKHKRILPNPNKNIDKRDLGKDIPVKPPKPEPEPEPEPKPKKPKDHTEDTVTKKTRR